VWRRGWRLIRSLVHSHVHECQMRTSLQWVPRMQCCLIPAWKCLFSSVYDYGWSQTGWMESLQCACHLLCPPLMLWVHHSSLATVFGAALLTTTRTAGSNFKFTAFPAFYSCLCVKLRNSNRTFLSSGILSYRPTRDVRWTSNLLKMGTGHCSDRHCSDKRYPWAL